jgi:site-specific recombinase XerD
VPNSAQSSTPNNSQSDSQRYFRNYLAEFFPRYYPAREVKTEKFSRTEGKTPAFVEGEVQQLLDVIEASTHTGLRDRALLGTLAYTFARIGAVVNLKVRSKTIIRLGNGFFFDSKRKEERRKSFPCTTSWKSSWTST